MTHHAPRITHHPLAILADDLTGACDAAAPFAARGLTTEVLLDPAGMNGAEVTVRAVDVDTRRLSRPVAAARTVTAARAVRARGAAALYKKIDSTLRGHVAAELRACMRGWGAPLAVLCPAFPAVGRWVQGGRLLVDGRGDVGPVAELAGFRRGDRLAHLDADLVERGADDVARALDDFRRFGIQVIIADANSPRQLATLAEAAHRLDPPPLLAGSAGLATAVADRVAGGEWRVAGGGLLGTRPWLVVAGSQTDVTAAQVAVLERAGAEVIVLDADELLARRALARTAGAAAGCALAAGLTPVLRLVVRSDPAAIGRPADDRLARALGRACRAAVERGQPAGLFLTGGSTARACLLALGARGLRLEAEPLPGIVLSRAIGGHWDSRPVITKAGGFGAPDALRRLVLREQAGGSGQ
jgi:uncharacterized protein YgbK (DUF1537 family)